MLGGGGSCIRVHVCERGGLKLDLPNEGERNGM